MINKTNTLIQEFREKFKIAHSYMDQDAGYLDEDTAKELEQFLLKAINQTAKEAREEVFVELGKCGVPVRYVKDDGVGWAIPMSKLRKVQAELSQENK